MSSVAKRTTIWLGADEREDVSGYVETIWLGADEREDVSGYVEVRREDGMIAIEAIEGNETIEVFIMPSLFERLRKALS